MAHRALKIVSLISTALMAIAVLLTVAAYVFDPRDHYLTLGRDFHISIFGDGLDARMVFFNDAEHGPYQGSIVGFVDSDGVLHPPFVRREGLATHGAFTTAIFSGRITRFGRCRSACGTRSPFSQ